MNTIRSYKANTANIEPVESLRIDFSVPFPDDISLTSMRKKYHQEADKIVDAFQRHLPQGLVDHILAELMRRRASLFIIPEISEENT